jgi:hypothetical protein
VQKEWFFYGEYCLEAVRAYLKPTSVPYSTLEDKQVPVTDEPDKADVRQSPY